MTSKIVLHQTTIDATKAKHFNLLIFYILGDHIFSSIFSIM